MRGPVPFARNRGKQKKRQAYGSDFEPPSPSAVDSSNWFRRAAAGIRSKLLVKRAQSGGHCHEKKREKVEEDIRKTSLI